MPIDRLDFDSLTEHDLAELIEAQVLEGLRIEYKRELYGNKDSDKREALKDISAFANSSGGHLLIGIEQKDGLPVNLVGIKSANADVEINWFEQLSRTGIEPIVQGLQVRSISLASGGHCLILRVPKSWNPPHRVSAQGSNRYWIRNSDGVHEASIDELRAMFTIGSDAVNHARRFRDLRLHEITSTALIRPLQGPGRLIIHLVPLAVSLSSFQIDVSRAFSIGQKFNPMGALGRSARFNLDGFINERGGEKNLGYTQVFRNGAIEATKGSIVGGNDADENRYVHAQKFEQDIVEALPQYFSGLSQLGVSPPIAVFFALEGMNRVRYRVRRSSFEDAEPLIERNSLYLPECIFNEFGSTEDCHRTIRPIFDALWNSAGYASAQSFTADGSWSDRWWKIV
jgi:hypothetical protein